MIKFCRKCGDYTDFYDTGKSRCKECLTVWGRQYNIARPGVNSARSARWRAEDPERSRAYNWKYAGFPEPTRPRPELCELCGGIAGGRGVLHLDHCHDTNAFRGWLCSKCNTGLGLLGDTKEAIARALKYLS